MRFGDKQLAALYAAACSVASQKGVPRGMEGREKDLRKAIDKMSAEIKRRAERREKIENYWVAQFEKNGAT